MDEKLLDRISTNDASIIEDIALAQPNHLSQSKKPSHITSIHLELHIGEVSNSESSSSSVQVFERPEMESIHPVVVYHLMSRLKRNKSVTIKDLTDILALKQVKAMCSSKSLAKLNKS